MTKREYLPTSTNKVLNAPFFPLQQVSSLPTAEVQYSCTWGQVRTNEDTLDPVVEVTHVINGTLQWSVCI